MESLTKVDKRNEALSALGDTYDAMARFINRTRAEKNKTVGALKKLEALINVNFENVTLTLLIAI